MSRCCSKCGSNCHNSRTCGGLSSSSGGGSGGSAAGGGDEIILFGVRMKVEPMRKSVSMNNLSQYEQPNNLRKSFSNSDESAKAADDAIAGGYASADDAVPHRSTGGRERKRGVPWTEEEHKLFLLGLQKVGKGDWRGISRNFVKTRTPTQVASHAQKYYLRRNNLNRRRRRTSLFEITTDTVTGKPREEGKSGEDNTAQAVLPATSLPPSEISNLNVFAVAPYPVPVGPILVPVQVQNPLANMTIRQADNLNNRSTVFFWPVSVPSPVIPVHNSATPPVINLNQRLAAEPSPLSWRLSLSSDQSQSSTRPSAFQVMQSFNHGDNIITVA